MKNELHVEETPFENSLQCFDPNGTEVLRIQADGDVIWKGRKVESDDEFKAAMIDLAACLKANIIPQKPLILEQDLEALRKDAERYRWLRERLNKTDIHKLKASCVYGVEEWNKNIDAAIDAAMEVK